MPVACARSEGAIRLKQYLASHRTRLLIQLPLIALSLAVVIWRVDLREAVRSLPDIDYRWALPGLLVFTTSKLIHAYRWRLFLWRREGVALGPLFAIFLASNLANALIPLRAGDLLRIDLPSRRFGIPRAELTGSVFVVETLLDGVAFVVLMFAGLVLLDVPPGYPTVLGLFAVIVAVAFAATVMLARVEGGRDFSMLPPLRWLPARPRAWLTALIPQFIDGLASLRSARRMLQAIAISLVAWLAEVAVYAMMGQAFGLDLEAAAYLPIMIAANLVVSLPLTPWDIGPYEVVVTEVTALAGATRAVASSFAVGSHLLLLVWMSISGLIAMLALDIRPRQLVSGRGGAGGGERTTDARRSDEP